MDCFKAELTFLSDVIKKSFLLLSIQQISVWVDGGRVRQKERPQNRNWLNKSIENEEILIFPDMGLYSYLNENQQVKSESQRKYLHKL